MHVCWHIYFLKQNTMSEREKLEKAQRSDTE